MEGLYLKFPSIDEKEKWFEYIKEYRMDNPNAKPLGCTEDLNYEQWLNTIEKESKGIDLLEGRVPSTVYFLMNNDRIIAHISIRHNIDNDFLRLYGGHIGYGVRPSERRKGYATIMLHLALIKCNELGIKDVMISCKESNIGSVKTIENNLGIQKELIYIEDQQMNFKKYWINVEDSINNYENRKGKSL